jgi:hypothetical protein
MARIKRFLAATLVVLLALGPAPATARTVTVEFLQAPINERTIDSLDGLACRNLDHIVHLKISVNWPADKLDEETTDYKRLVFWTDKAEYLFPNGGYTYRHGDYAIDGYFIPKNGGIRQGITSTAFDKIDDAKVLHDPSVKEVKAKRGGC